jgi:hypothetical protein
MTPRLAALDKFKQRKVKLRLIDRHTFDVSAGLRPRKRFGGSKKAAAAERTKALTIKKVSRWARDLK